MPEPSEQSAEQSSGAGAAIAAVAALGSVLAAASCCLPVLPFVLAAGFAGGSTLLDAARPYLLGASVLFIALGFYQARRAKQCRRKPSKAGAILLWMSAAIVGASIFFPQTMANAAANLFAFSGGQPPAGQPALQNLDAENLAAIESRFNAAKDDVRVLLLLSPT